MCVAEISRLINNTHWAIGKFLKEKGLTAKNGAVKYERNLELDESPVVYDVVEQKFERPPAVYSNQQWNY
jgi:hypothetical protein